MPDGGTRQRPRTAVPKSREDSRYDASPFVWFRGVSGYPQTSYGLKAGVGTRPACSCYTKHPVLPR